MTERTIGLPREIASLALSALLAALEDEIQAGGGDDLKVKHMAIAELMRENSIKPQPLPAAQADGELYRAIATVVSAQERLTVVTKGQDTMKADLVRRVCTRYVATMTSPLSQNKTYKRLIGLTLAELKKLSHEERLAFMYECLTWRIITTYLLTYHREFFPLPRSWGDFVDGILAITVMDGVQNQMQFGH
ncbi:MAG TPA: hypothetical protein VLG40_05055 [Candidatus Saccharimonas sp.]|nr:hypothetical protein [Candidatus Saccharimonas sp.]